MSPREFLHTSVSKIPKWLLVVLSLLGFYYFSHGFSVGPGTAIGYAEEIIHQVGPLQAGRIKELRVSLGQQVKAGEIVALMDARPLELQRATLLAELARLQADLVAEEDLQASLLQRGQIQAVRAYSDVQRMRAEMREYEKQLSRLKKLQKQKLVRADEVENAQRQKSSLSANLSSRPSGNLRDQELMGLRPRPKSDQERRLQDRLGPFRSAIAVKEAELSQLQHSLSELILRAPVDGIVGPILQRQGDVIAAATPILQIITGRPDYLLAFVPERQIARYPKNGLVELRKPGLVGKVWFARIVELGPQVEEVPLRSRPTHNVPSFGRRIVLKLETAHELIPGESFRVNPR